MNTPPKPEVKIVEKQPEIREVREVSKDAGVKKDTPVQRKSRTLDADADDIVPGYSDPDIWYEP